MALRKDVVLVADGGDMTVGRQTAVYTYGNFQVILPDDREQEAGDDRLQEGYVSRPLDPPTGRFDIGFVRADTTIDLNVGTSDLESVIDTAQKRVEGDVFFERDISGRGLGRYRPGVDFDIGDIVQVEVWGKRLFLPVTSIEMVASESEGVGGWRVHVGGQLVADADALRRHNDDVAQQIASEKRQRLREVGAVRETANTAKSTADDALAAATDADGVVQLKVEEARRLIDEGRVHAAAVAGHVEEAGRLSQSAADYAQQAVDAADQADLILAGVGDDVQAARDALAQIQPLHQQVIANVQLAQQAVTDGQAHVVEANRLTGVASGHAGAAQDYAAEANVLVEEAEALNAQMQAMQTQMTQMVLAGQRLVASAAGQAALAVERAGAAQQIVAEARLILDESAATSEQAQDALDNARAALAQLDSLTEDGKSLGEVIAEVLWLHQDTLEKHQLVDEMHTVVLTKHGEAIDAVADAAAQAGLAAADAGAAAGSVLAAQQIQKGINTTQQAINELYGKAIRAAATSGAQAGAAAMQAAMAADQANRAAQEALTASGLNADSIILLGDADALLDTAIKNNADAILKLQDAAILTNQAVRAAAASAASAGGAGRQAARAAKRSGDAASSALEATAALADADEAMQETQRVQGLAQANQEVATRKAGEAAATAQQMALDLLESQQWQWQKLICPRSKSFRADGQMFVQFMSDTEARVSPYAGWVGEIMVKGLFANNTVQPEWVEIPMLGEYITIGGGNTALKVVEVEYQRNVGTARRHDASASNMQLAAENTWYTGASWNFTATATTSYSILFQVGWDAAGHDGEYHIQILRNGAMVAESKVSQLGPFWPGQDGYRTQVIDRTTQKLNFSKNDTISFRVRRNLAMDLPTQRKIRDLKITATWLEPPA